MGSLPKVRDLPQSELQQDEEGEEGPSAFSSDPSRAQGHRGWGTITS